jgi:DNA-directed RNA polymerase specialized sigma24 family protein
MAAYKGGYRARARLSDRRLLRGMATHHAEIYRYLRPLTFQSAEADDLSQETFLRAFRVYSPLPWRYDAVLPTVIVK